MIEENQYLSSETLYCEFLGFCRTFHISSCLNNILYFTVRQSIRVLLFVKIFCLYSSANHCSIIAQYRSAIDVESNYVSHPRTISRPHSCTLTEFQTSRSISKGNLTSTSIFRWHGPECFAVYAFSRARIRPATETETETSYRRLDVGDGSG